MQHIVTTEEIVHCSLQPIQSISISEDRLNAHNHRNQEHVTPAFGAAQHGYALTEWAQESIARMRQVGAFSLEEVGPQDSICQPHYTDQSILPFSGRHLSTSGYSFPSLLSQKSEVICREAQVASCNFSKLPVTISHAYMHSHILCVQQMKIGKLNLRLDTLFPC